MSIVLWPYFCRWYTRNKSVNLFK